MSDLMKGLYERRSCRKYLDKMVSKEEIEKVIDAGLYAASGRGEQATITIAVTNKELRDKLSKVNAKIWGNNDFDPFYGAPVVLVVLYNKERATGIYDGSLVTGNMMLAAHDLGLGSCWIHRAKETFEMDEYKEVLKELGVEGEYEGVGNLILGYPDGETASPAPRKENRVYWVE